MLGLLHHPLEVNVPIGCGGTLVVPGDFFWVRGFIRVSAGMDEDILRQGLKNIGKAIDRLKDE